MKALKQISTDNKDIFFELYKKIIKAPEPFLLKKFRKAAWKKMENTSWSDLDREDWRYTRHDEFLPKNSIPSGSYDISIKGLTVENIKEGVKAVCLPEQVKEATPFIKLIEKTGYFKDKWTSLNGALFNGSVFLNVPKNYKVKATLHIKHDLRGDGLEFPLTYIKLEEGSELNVIEEYSGQENDSKNIISNTVLDIGAGANLNHLFIQNLSPESKGLFYQNSALARDASYQTHSVQLGSKTARIMQNAEFNEPGSNMKNYGLLYGRKRQHIDIQSNQVHRADNTVGELLHRHVLTDRAKSIFKGKVIIEKDKKFCNAIQKNENLLLSPKAEAVSLPKLEISNNEVQCSHGATVSSIDEEQLFYLASRGISEADARKMIVEGFFDEIIKKLSMSDGAEITTGKLKEAL